jgi:phosphoribosylanthranilate isomerase
LDFVQLHGGESVEKCESLKKNKVGVIKVFSIDKDFDFDEVNDFISCTDFFLFDTKSDGYGGSGLAFDWSMLNRYKANVPFFLSGGLSPENIAQALTLKTPNLFALDINSGVEISPGLKNIDKIKIINTILNSH